MIDDGVLGDGVLGDGAMVQQLKSFEQREIDYWRDSEHESPESDSIYNLVNKMFDVGVLMNILDLYKGEFIRDPSCRVLELGGGQGWGACLVKRSFPDAHVTLTDVSTFAVQSAGKWERLFGVSLDSTYACTSYATRELCDSVDIVFCFAAAHHFHAHRKTLAEIRRILRPGGVAMYFYEPTCPRLLHAFAYNRANRIRPAVEEDVLVRNHVLRIASEMGLNARVDFYPSLERRSVSAMIYYSILAKAKFLCALLPCTANFVFRKLP